MNATIHNTLCIYHGNCADGFASALAVYMELGVDCEFIAGIHGDAPPDVTDRFVYIVDFAYKRDVLIEMADKAKQIVILDHHQSAEKYLVDLPGNVETIFDMSQSGVGLTWNHFHKGKEMPQLFKHVQDRDLWKFELEGTREIQIALFSYPYDFGIWMDLLNDGVEGLRSDGIAIQRKHMKDINELIKVAAFRTIIAGHEVPCINISYMQGSEACNILAEGEKFSAYYWNCHTYSNFGLRSKDNGLDVSEIAISFGGGGHKHASGFRLPIQDTSISKTNLVETENA